MAGDGVQVVLEGDGCRAQNRRRVPARGLGVGGDARRFLGEHTRRTEAMPHVGVARRDRHHAEFSGRADPDRWVGCLHRPGTHRRIVGLVVLAVEAEPVGGEQAAHDLHRFFERVDAVAEVRERDAERGVFLLEPRRAVREFEPAARRMVDGQRFGGEDRRVAVGEPGNEDAETHVGGDPTPRGQGGHGLEAFPGTLAVHRLEVVEAPDAVEAHGFRETRPIGVLGPGHALLGDVESEAHPHLVSPTLPRCRGLRAAPSGHGARKPSHAPLVKRLTAVAAPPSRVLTSVELNCASPRPTIPSRSVLNCWSCACCDGVNRSMSDDGLVDD